MRHKFTPALLGLCCLLTIQPVTAAAPLSMPNILILYADDMGYGDLGANNPSSKIPTPNLDRLAAEGLRFTDGHSSSGICTPSRYAMLTGRHHWRDFHGIAGAFDGPVFKPGQLTLAAMLRQKGYTTACIGKWHLGMDWDAIRKPGTNKKSILHTDFDWTARFPGGPLDHGFDYYFGDNVINFPPYAWIENDRLLAPPDMTLTNVPGKPKEGAWECRPGPGLSDWDFYQVLPTLTRKAVEYLQSRKGKEQPFLLYFPLPSPHAPIVPVDAFDGTSSAGAYGDFVVQTDDSCGQLLAALREAGLDQNTIVVFTSDNGPEFYAYDRDNNFDHWSAAPFRGLKRDIYEGGHHVPFIIKWPGFTKPGAVSDVLISQVDLMATFAELVGFDLSDRTAEDSQSFLPWLRGEISAPPRDTLIHNTNPKQYAIRHGDWLLVDHESGYARPAPAAWNKKHNQPPDDSLPNELYNLKNDSGQRTNLAAQLPGQTAQLRKLMENLRAESHSTTRSAESSARLARGSVWFQSDFEDADPKPGWSAQPELDTGFKGGRSVVLRSTSPGAGARLIRRLPVDAVRGSMVRGSVMVKAGDISAKPNPWNGIKCMLIIETPGGTHYPQAPLNTGTFDWVSSQFAARIPADATNVTLMLGLEQVTGDVWFDDVRFTVVKVPIASPDPIPGPMYKGHDLPRLRGAMISPGITPESLHVLGGDWNVNLIRWQFIRTGRQTHGDEADYDRWLDDQLQRLDAALPICEKLGVHVVVDLHSPPGGKATTGGYMGSDAGLFTDKRSQDKFVSIWRNIATRYKDAKAIWGYDLVNEPVEDDVADDCLDWQALAERAARAIREIDPQRTIIVEPARWGGPDGLDDLVPIRVSNVVYSVHMYLPHAFTHQNVHGQTPSYVYPGEVGGKHWDKEQLKAALQPALDFQKRYNVHMYIGEFSAIRWAPEGSAARYLEDVIEIFEEYGWDWSYHAFREWHGWSVEHGDDRNDTRPASSPTDRQKLLRRWFGKNEKPRW
jgi:arylsulfatase A